MIPSQKPLYMSQYHHEHILKIDESSMEHGSWCNPKQISIRSLVVFVPIPKSWQWMASGFVWWVLSPLFRFEFLSTDQYQSCANPVAPNILYMDYMPVWVLIIN